MYRCSWRPARALSRRQLLSRSLRHGRGCTLVLLAVQLFDQLALRPIRLDARLLRHRLERTVFAGDRRTEGVSRRRGRGRASHTHRRGLRAGSPCWIKFLREYPLRRRGVSLSGRIFGGQPATCTWTLAVAAPSDASPRCRAVLHQRLGGALCARAAGALARERWLDSNAVKPGTPAARASSCPAAGRKAARGRRQVPRGR